MNRNIKVYLLTFAVFLVIDMIWLSVIASSLYSRYLGYIMSPTPNLFAAFVFYALFIVGLLVFVILPALKEKSMQTTLGRAALFGLVTYATYDLTNLATLKDWPLTITIIDLIWGTVLSTLVTWISLMLIKRLRWA
jgi:uncharacterized membrane protein